MSRRYAIVSIGSNSTRALLADVAASTPRVEFARSIGTRIGEGLDAEGMLGEEPMRRTLDAAGALLRAMRGHYVRLFAVATSAVRRAENAEVFAARAQSVLGVPLRVLSGEEEARASYRGALTALRVDGKRVGVLDAGGGSTEYAVGTETSPECVVSCEIGAVRLTDAVPELAGIASAEAIERARAIARAALAPLASCPAVVRAAVVGGTATTAASVLRGRAEFRDRSVTRGELSELLDRLASMTLEQRRALAGMKPQRADILAAGAIVLDTALEIAGCSDATATTADLLLGLLLEQRDADPPAAGHGAPLRAGSGTPKGVRHA